MMRDDEPRAATHGRAAVFLDRDGVLIEEVDLLTRTDEVRILKGSGEAVCALKAAGYAVVVITNQTVVARGLIDLADVEAIHEQIQGWLPCPVDGFYVCPHHPSADLELYRVECQCRKPRPGLILQACRDLEVACDRRSFMIGDRMSDIAAGAAAGCTTILVESGCHQAPPIESPEPVAADCRPNHRCADLAAAADWILGPRMGSLS
jgi:D-glycero-D-manno-heptose 1,7-bisphosphate phosphatase